MADAPVLEYARVSSRWRRFGLGVVVGSGAAVIANVVPYVFTYHAWRYDGFEQIGFPMTFREEGGDSYRYMYSVRGLILDVLFCLGVGLASGLIASLWKRHVFRHIHQGPKEKISTS